MGQGDAEGGTHRSARTHTFDLEKSCRVSAKYFLKVGK